MNGETSNREKHFTKAGVREEGGGAKEEIMYVDRPYKRVNTQKKYIMQRV